MEDLDPASQVLGNVFEHVASSKLKEAHPALTEALAQVALIAAPTAAAAGGISTSQWRSLVREGVAPPPAVSAARFTRWRIMDVARFWAQAPELLGGHERAEDLQRQARAASAAARKARASRRLVQRESEGA